MRQAFKILHKEILEASRDRGLVLHLILIPLFLYPLLGFGAWQIFLLIQGNNERNAPVVVLDRDLPVDLADSLRASDGLLLETLDPDVFQGRPPSTDEFRRLRKQRSQAPPAVLLGYDRKQGRESFRLYYDSSREGSMRARGRITPLVERRIAREEEKLGHQLGMAESDLEPFKIVEVDSASRRQMGRYILSLLLPVLLVIMLPQGAYYATLDTVVGERERGTLETLVSSALKRSEIILGKFLFVTLSSLVSFALNLLSLSLFLSFALRLMGLENSWGVSLPVQGLVVVLLAALLTAAFLSAAMMVAAVPSRNYREGQTALMPLYLLPALAGLVIATQGDTLSPTLSLIPVVNVAALLRETLRGELDPRLAFYSLVSLTLFTGLLLGFAARIGRREEILFDPRLQLRRLLRRERTSR